MPSKEPSFTEDIWWQSLSESGSSLTTSMIRCVTNGLHKPALLPSPTDWIKIRSDSKNIHIACSMGKTRTITSRSTKDLIVSRNIVLIKYDGITAEWCTSFIRFLKTMSILETILLTYGGLISHPFRFYEQILWLNPDNEINTYIHNVVESRRHVFWQERTIANLTEIFRIFELSPVKYSSILSLSGREVSFHSRNLLIHPKIITGSTCNVKNNIFGYSHLNRYSFLSFFQL